jgi:hypothetical protein
MADIEFEQQNTDFATAEIDKKKAVESKYNTDDPELQRIIQEAVAQHNAGLERNRNKIRDDLISTKLKLKEFEQAYAGVDPQQYKELLTQREQAEAERIARETQELEKRGEYTKLMQQKEQLIEQIKNDYEARLSTTEQAKNSLQSRLHNSVGIAQLRNELIAANVTQSALMQGAVALLGPQLEVVEDGDTFVVKMAGLPINDAIKTWAASEIGKHYVTANLTSGGGTPPSQTDRGVPAGKYPKRRSEFTTKQKISYQKDFGIEAYQDLPL